MQTITMYLRAASVKGTLVDEWNQALSSLPALTRGMRAELVLKFVDANGAAMGVPYAIVAGTSAGYTYASAKLDHQTYFRILRNERGFMEDSILNRLFELWLREWSLAHPDLGGHVSPRADSGGLHFVATGEEGAADSPPLLSTWNASWL